MDELRLDLDGAVATITIRRPDKRNALTQQMWDELAVLATRVADSPAAHVLVVRSDVPGIFSAGADIGEYRRFAGDVAWGMASQARVGRALEGLRVLRIPTIAVIDGGCVGGGSSIALACDFRIASTSAFFAITPARLGLVFPHEDVTALVDLVGAAAAKRILFTGSRFEAEWALRSGFVDELHPSAELAAALDRWVDELTAVAPGSLRAMKEIIGLVRQGVRATTERSRNLVEEALASPDHREGVTAFLERRPARFTA
jgi:enoyl-CoA hydratase/carnithine racemase